VIRHETNNDVSIVNTVYICEIKLYVKIRTTNTKTKRPRKALLQITIASPMRVILEKTKGYAIY
jgi:hypothetical protein